MAFLAAFVDAPRWDTDRLAIVRACCRQSVTLEASLCPTSPHLLVRGNGPRTGLPFNELTVGSP